MLKQAFNLLREHWRAYLAINIFFYGLIVAGMLLAVRDPQLQNLIIQIAGQAFMGQAGAGLAAGALPGLLAAYLQGRVLLAALYTFLFNLAAGSFLAITLPSLIVPFLGFLIGAGRAIIWGVVFSPFTDVFGAPFLPHYLTMIIEGQGYVLALLAAYIHGRAWLRPASVGADSHARGYLQGLRDTGRLYLLVAIVLAISAVYEALELILILQRPLQ